jgi:ketosteroid isomerase-like protein
MAQEPMKHDLVEVAHSLADYVPGELDASLGCFAPDAVWEDVRLPLAQGVR